MNYNIRKEVLANLKSANFDSIKGTIDDAIAMQEEKVLPGLGVMLELAWQKATPDVRNHIISTIEQAVKL
jgi:small acid-soluble spore protein I (minor)